MYKLAFVLCLLVVSQLTHGACTGNSPTWSASADRASINTCITNASEGDTINIGAGTVSWSGVINITKALSIIGSGTSSTIINANASAVFSVDFSSEKNFRLSGIAFTGSGGYLQLETTLLNLRGNLSGNIRLDHLKFTNISRHAVTIMLWDVILTNPRVLFDHIDYSCASCSSYGRFLKLESVGTTWMSQDGAGTNDFVFIEDSSFTWTGTANPNSAVTDTEYGARLVVRNNTISGGGVQVHDTGSTDASRGQRYTEIYNNTFTCTITGCGSITAIGLRGGGWLVYNNNIAAGFWQPGYPQIYRATIGPGYLGDSCDTTPKGACATPTFYHCSGGDHRACGYSGSTCPVGTCVIAAASSEDCPVDYPYVSNLDRVDGGNGDSGYPCRDQTGWGQQNADGTQNPSPVYWWGNTRGGAPLSLNYDISPWFLANRDYCNHSPSTACGAKTSWTYTAYTYPHPLQGGETNVDIINPSISSLMVPSSGTTLVMGFSEEMRFAGATPTLSASGGSLTLSGCVAVSNTITCNTSRQILDTEVLTASYTQIGNGIEDLAGNDLPSFSEQAITNNSSQIIVVLSGLIPATGTRYRKEVTSIAIGLSTNKSASCRYGKTPGLPWANLTAYTTTGAMSHSKVFPITSGSGYQVCSRCLDTAAAQYSGDSCTRFSVRAVRKQVR